MKFVKTKQCLFVGSALLLSAAVITGCALSAKIYRTAPTDTFTVSSNDGYYSETTYFLTEEAYKEHSMQTEENTQANRKTTLNASAPDADEGEFVLGAIQSIVVSETVAEDGSIADSHPMTENELEYYGINPAYIGINDPWQNSTWGGGGGSGESDTIIANKSDEMYLLTLNFELRYSSYTNKYFASGEAVWEDKWVPFWQTDEAAEEWNLDFMGITWGGEKTLKIENADFSASYYNDNTVDYSIAKADSYAGYVWQFNEKSGYLGKELKYARANVDIKKIGTPLNKETNIVLTYIHTYGAISGGISFEFDSEEKLSAGISLSLTDKQWQIQIDIPGIIY